MSLDKNLNSLWLKKLYLVLNDVRGEVVTVIGNEAVPHFVALEEMMKKKIAETDPKDGFIDVKQMR
jgi:hypothetical protein